MATLFLICGLPGAGKTTLARRLEAEHGALRLTPDEWIHRLHGTSLDQERLDALRDPMESLQWEVASRVLSAGMSVILDWGFWSRAEREEFRARAARIGADTQVHVLDVPRHMLDERLATRNASLPPGAFRVTQAQLDQWVQLWEPQADMPPG